MGSEWVPLVATIVGAGIAMLAQLLLEVRRDRRARGERERASQIDALSGHLPALAAATRDAEKALEEDRDYLLYREARPGELVPPPSRQYDNLTAAEGLAARVIDDSLRGEVDSLVAAVSSCLYPKGVSTGVEGGFQELNEAAQDLALARPVQEKVKRRLRGYLAS